MEAVGPSSGGEDDRVLPPDPAGFGFDIDRDLFCTADASGRFTSLNAAWERTLGWTREELMSRPNTEFVHPEDVPATNSATALLARADEQLTRFENRYRTADGHWRWLRWSVRSDGTTVIGIAIDVTDERRAESRIRAAIRDGGLIAEAQPIVDLDSGATVGQELLVRMRDTTHPELVLPPAEFLPEAEADGSVCLIDRWMTRQALELAKSGHASSVNISARFVTDEDMVEELCGVLAEAGAEARRVSFELSETTALDHEEASIELSERLSALGYGLALDGFGLALATVTQLRPLRFSSIKIDRGFVAAIDSDPEHRAVVRGIAAMAAELDLPVVAVGIEREPVLDLCRAFGIPRGQGYLLGRPEVPGL